MDEELRMSFSASVLRQTQMARKRSTLIPALASARVQRTDGARAPAFSRHPKLLIHLARVHQRISALKFGWKLHRASCKGIGDKIFSRCEEIKGLWHRKNIARTWDAARSAASHVFSEISVIRG
jgi:hypothetical protein